MSDESLKKIKLGSTVKDVVTEFEGIAVCRLESLDGAVDIGIQAKSTKDDKQSPIQYIAEVRLQVIDEGINIAPVKRSIGFKTS